MACGQSFDFGHGKIFIEQTLFRYQSFNWRFVFNAFDIGVVVGFLIAPTTAIIIIKNYDVNSFVWRGCL